MKNTLLLFGFLFCFFLNAHTQSNWQPMGPAESSAISQDIMLAGVSAMDSSGKLYYAYLTTNNYIHVKQFDGTNWNAQYCPLQASGSFASAYLNFVCDNQGRLCLLYFDYVSAQLTLSRYDGTGWSNISSFTLTTDSLFTNSITLLADKHGPLYLSYLSDSLGYRSANVLKYNDTAWTFLGKRFSPVQTEDLQITTDTTGRPYVFYTNNTVGYASYAIHLLMYTDTGWVSPHGGNVPYSSSNVASLGLKADKQNNIYVAYGAQSFGTPLTMYFYKLDTAGNWRSLTGGVPPIDSFSSQSLTFSDSGYAYFSYIDNRDLKLNIYRIDTVDTGSVQHYGLYASFFNAFTERNSQGLAQVYWDSTNHAIFITGASGSAFLGYPLFTGFRYDAGYWTQLGSGGLASLVPQCKGNFTINENLTGNKQLIVSPGGVPYVVLGGIYTDTPAILVLKYTGGAWSAVGQPFLYDSLYNGWNLSIAVDNNETPYVLYWDGIYTGLIKYNGTDWAYVGQPGFIPHPKLAQLAIDNNGTPYVAYCNATTGALNVTKYNNTTWQPVGSFNNIFNIYLEGLYQLTLGMDSGVTPTLVYTVVFQGATYPYDNTIMTAKYLDTSWVLLNSAPYQTFENPELGMAMGQGNAPTIVFSRYGYPENGYLSVQNFQDTAWSPVGGSQYIGLGPGSYPAIAIDGAGRPCVSFADGNYGSKMSVLRYNGSAWNYIGTPGFSSCTTMSQSVYPTFSTFMAADNTGNMYTMYVDMNQQFWAFSNNLSCFGTTPQTLCVVTVDSVTNHPVVVWEKANKPATDSFYIYRTITPGTAYALAGVVGRDSLSAWLDPTASSDSASYRYKIAVKDICGFTGNMSPYHQTIFLSYLSSGNFGWTPYEIENSASPASSYSLYRDITGTGNWQLVATVPGTQTTATDTAFASYPNARYRVIVTLNSPCNPTRSVNAISSNIITLVANAVAEILPDDVKVIPNPVAANFSIFTTAAGPKQFDISDELGRTVFQGSFDSRSTLIDAGAWSKGIYICRVIAGGKIYRVRLVKE